MSEPTVYYTVYYNQHPNTIRQARASLGNPAALDEAIVATGIDALLDLLDGKQIKIAGVGVVKLVVLGITDDE